jgi:TDG/mug DNA glycosylase family protein
VKSIGFGSVARADASVLILGSLPGQVSLARGEYYAQPQNAFWRIMGDLVGASRDLPYHRRLHLLIENRIALWDVCAAGERSGSLDSAIRVATVEANDLAAFLRTHPAIGLICFNGRKAKEIYDRLMLQKSLPLFERIRHEVLPSTSPAHATMTYEQKLSRWRGILAEACLSRLQLDSAAPGPPESLKSTRVTKGASHEKDSTISCQAQTAH